MYIFNLGQRGAVSFVLALNWGQGVTHSPFPGSRVDWTGLHIWLSAQWKCRMGLITPTHSRWLPGQKVRLSQHFSACRHWVSRTHPGKPLSCMQTAGSCLRLTANSKTGHSLSLVLGPATLTLIPIDGCRKHVVEGERGIRRSYQVSAQKYE